MPLGHRLDASFEFNASLRALRGEKFLSKSTPHPRKTTLLHAMRT